MLNKSLLARMRRDDHGFSMVVTVGAIGVMMLSAVISVGTLSSDQPVGRTDQDRKTAFAAAEAGLQVYVHKLVVDNAYWTKCDVDGDGVNLRWDKPAPAPGPQPVDPREWKALSDNTAAYTIESLPANNKPSCLTGDPEATMIDDLSQTFRVRITGQAINPGTRQRSGPKRSLIASFRRRSFLDYIYFTDLEVQDPTVYPSVYAQGLLTKENPRSPASLPQRNIETWGNEMCGIYSYLKHPDNSKYRSEQQFIGDDSRSAGKYDPVTRRWSDVSAKCVEIQFAPDDQIKGPLHTNDAPRLCGNPIFGRTPKDLIETSAYTTLTGSSVPADSRLTDGYRTSAGCSGTKPSVNFEGKPITRTDRGTWVSQAPTVTLPTTNGSLQDEASPTYTFIGETKLELTSAGIKVLSGRNEAGTTFSGQTLNYPTEGVVYVNNDTCPIGYQASDPYAEYTASRSGCGIAWVKGEYAKDLTIATADDIIINGKLTQRADSGSLLGLIANNFVRVYHPVLNPEACARSSRSDNKTGSLYNVTIEAAILTLRHSFLVDNWKCGASLGDLTINGAISQKYRGPVGTSGNTGYSKDYVYDKRFKLRSPPKFLDPDSAAWNLRFFQEQAKPT